MEQFRAFLEIVKKYHFWVLCGLIVVLSFGSWFSGDQRRSETIRQPQGQD